MTQRWQTVSLETGHRNGYQAVLVEDSDDDDFDGIVGDFGEGEGNPRCQWDFSVCSETVTHYITMREFEDIETWTVHSSTYCQRHYAVELARFTTFHEQDCAVGLAQHLAAFGAFE